MSLIALFGWAGYFDQTEKWKTKDDGWVRIADMGNRHRLNSAALLLRKAGWYADITAAAELRLFGDAPDDVADSWLQEISDRDADPVRWMRGTALYRALVAGLAVDLRVPDDLMAREGVR
jgi:hypothetical protein